MTYEAKIIKDSINRVGNRLTTFELTYPRFVHAELMTHRMFSRNSASSRAIPIERMIERIQSNPAMPLFWGKNQKGMQAAEELQNGDRLLAQSVWLEARRHALEHAKQLLEIGAHKQIVNRVLEPWMFITTIVTATEFTNFFYLRDSEFAQPEIAWVAREMKKLYADNEPTELRPGEWHLPYVEIKDSSHPLYVEPYEDARIWPDGSYLAKISTARCARVSYLTHDGRRDLREDERLHDQLRTSGHWSPFEHPAMALNKSARNGNFIGFVQYRKQWAGEHHGRLLP